MIASTEALAIAGGQSALRREDYGNWPVLTTDDFGGIITPFGLHFGGKSVIPLDVNDMIFRKIMLRPTFAEPAINFPVANRLLRDGLVDGEALVTHTFGFGDAKRVMQAIIDGSEPIVQAVMRPNR
jgi:L-iditol 2-dehydrogenase